MELNTKILFVRKRTFFLSVHFTKYFTCNTLHRSHCKWYSIKFVRFQRKRCKAGNSDVPSYTNPSNTGGRNSRSTTCHHTHTNKWNEMKTKKERKKENEQITINVKINVKFRFENSRNKGEVLLYVSSHMFCVRPW